MMNFIQIYIIMFISLIIFYFEILVNFIFKKLFSNSYEVICNQFKVSYGLN